MTRASASGGPLETEIEEELRRVLEGTEPGTEAGPAPDDDGDAPIPVNLALQGHGLKGAFAWGALDYLLETGRFAFPAISATGTAALTAAACLSGGGTARPEGARAAMAALWKEMAGPRLPFGDVFYRSPLAFPLWSALPFLQAPLFSPYLANPFLANPLRQIIDRFDFDTLAEADETFYVGLTNARTGRIRVFEGHSLAPSVLEAASADPMLHKAVEIEGEAYWSGSLVGDPPLFPLYGEDCEDILLITSLPRQRNEIDTSIQGLQDRVMEIAGMAALSRELRAVHFVKALLRSGTLSEDSMRAPRLHLVRSALMEDLRLPRGAADAGVTESLFDEGRDAMRSWLDRHAESIGTASTLSQEEMFL